MMKRNLRASMALLHGGLITAMLMAMSAGVVGYHEATSQTGNATTSQTGNATSVGNQTSQSLGNLTKADFLPAQADFANARDMIFVERNLGAYLALNAADNDLYTVIDRLELEPEVSDLLKQQIVPVRQSINDAQEAIFDGDFAKALQDVNSASTALVKITLPLPSGETGEE
jgi:hypothetical protein